MSASRSSAGVRASAASSRKAAIVDRSSGSPRATIAAAGTCQRSTAIEDTELCRRVLDSGTARPLVIARAAARAVRLGTGAPRTSSQRSRLPVSALQSETSRAGASHQRSLSSASPAKRGGKVPSAGARQMRMKSESASASRSRSSASATHCTKSSTASASSPSSTTRPSSPSPASVSAASRRAPGLMPRAACSRRARRRAGSNGPGEESGTPAANART